MSHDNLYSWAKQIITKYLASFFKRSFSVSCPMVLRLSNLPGQFMRL